MVSARKADGRGGRGEAVDGRREAKMKTVFRRKMILSNNESDW